MEDIHFLTYPLIFSIFSNRFLQAAGFFTMQPLEFLTLFSMDKLKKHSNNKEMTDG